ncbi:Protein of unknown function [Cotesia congregata]|uniref:Uncharacterized protein n=1 Tax=Cotesia congregata TaxID=51543 RepID=A0A8J2HBI8_COTCN|nr:Protein of unknown function [Cotesia congregata]
MQVWCHCVHIVSPDPSVKTFPGPSTGCTQIEKGQTPNDGFYNNSQLVNSQEPAFHIYVNNSPPEHDSSLGNDGDLNNTAIDVSSPNYLTADVSLQEGKRRGRLTNAERLARIDDKSQTKLNLTKRKERDDDVSDNFSRKKNAPRDGVHPSLSPLYNVSQSTTMEPFNQTPPLPSLPPVNSLQDLVKQLMIWRQEDKSNMAKFKAEVFECITNETDRLRCWNVTTIIFWNARGLPEPEVLLSLKEGTIINVSETWRTSGKTYLPSSLDSYNKVWSPAVKNKILGRPSGGLLTLISKDLTALIPSTALISVVVSNFNHNQRHRHHRGIALP